MKSTILYFFIGIFFIPTVEAHYKGAQAIAPVSTQSEEATEAISNFKATPLSSSSIELSWNITIFDSRDYTIERSTNGSETTLLKANAGWFQTAITYVDNGLDANQTYAYRIKEESASEFAAETVATTEEEAPAAPTSFTATALSSTAITLTWVDNADNEEGYKVERLSTDGETYTEIAQLPANTTTYEDGPLQYNTVYTYRISAYNAIGGSEYIIASATTPNVAPASPSELNATSTASSITLIWTDNADNETAYIVERSSTGAEGSYAPLAVLEPNTTAYINDGLKHKTIYYYRVKAQNAIGASEYIHASATTLNVAPSTPTSLVATDISISQIRLEWVDNADNEDGYTVEWSPTGATGSFTAITTSLSPNTNTYTHTGLVSNTTYYYRVKATNEVGSSAYSATITATTLKNPPSLPPTNLTAKESTTNTITLTWANNASNATGFIIERTLTPINASSFQEVATLGIAPLTYTDEGLKPNTTYFYRIKATNKDGESGYSSVAAGNTKLEVGPPAAPTEFKATAVSTFQINLSWKDNADNEVNYKIERATEATGSFHPVKSNLPPNIEIFQDVGLQANTTYYYRVIALNDYGSSESVIISATTLENPQPPSAPTSLSAVAVSTVQINLSWKDNSNSETNFKIERSTSSTGPFEFIAAVSANVTTYQNFGLSANSTYYYRVQAISGDGASAFTNTANAKTYAAPQPPSAPSNLIATGVSTSQINLTWQDKANNETGFVVERATSSDGPFSFIGSVGANTTSFESTGLNANTQYYYKVRAINSDGSSGYSNTASSTTLQVPIAPTAPTNLTANGVSTTQINLSWQDNSSSETNFEIYRSNTSGGPLTLLASVPANQTTYESTGLSPNTTYYYRVLASSKDGKSAYSNEASATTSGVALPPNGPDGLTALAVSTTQINLKWNDRSDNETNFVIERSIGNNTHYEIIADVNANDTTFESTALTAGQTYFYRVRASNEDGNSAYSNEASAATLSTGVAPNAPSDLYGRVLSQTSIELFWTDNANNEEFFILERAEERNGEKGSFVPIDNTIKSNTTSYVNSGLASDTKYWYRVKAKNQDGESSYAESTAIITSVDGKPVIVMLGSNFPSFYISGTEQQEVSIKIAEPTDIAKMKLIHKPIRENTWKEKDATSTGDNEYHVFIKQIEDLDEIGVEYYFMAEDGSGKQYVSPIARTYMAFEDNGLTLPNLKFGSDISAYQMISIPLALENATVSAVFGDDLGPYDPKEWRLFGLDNGDVLEVSPSNNIEPGKGYWLIMKDQTSVGTGAGNVVQVTQEEPFVWSLKQGWNFIGNPYPFDISWADVLAANGYPEAVAALPYTYTSTYTEAPTLKAFQGAYIFADENIEITVPLAKTTANNGGRVGTMTASHKHLKRVVNGADEGWGVDFTLKTDKLQYALSGLGMHQEANLSKDRYDAVALPKLSEYVDIQFEHSEYFSPLFTKDIVPLQKEFIWNMKVVASSAHSPIEISWEKPANLPLGKQLVLYDPVQQTIVDMITNNRYVTTGVESPLQVYYGNAQFIKAQLKPHSVQIGDAYPNPFTESLFLPIVLLESDKPYHVQIQLYNSFGVEVGTTEFILEGGFHEVKVIEENDGKLGSGVYFYKAMIKQGGALMMKRSGRLIKR